MPLFFEGINFRYSMGEGELLKAVDTKELGLALEHSIEPTLEPSIDSALEPSIGPALGPSIAPSLEPFIGPVLEPSIEPNASVYEIESSHTGEDKMVGVVVEFPLAKDDNMVITEPPLRS